MRTVSEEEALEIAEVIHRFGKNLYSKNGKKFLEEAKKFLNEEPCWVSEESVDPSHECDHMYERIGIIGSLHGMGAPVRIHQCKVCIIDAQMGIETFGATGEPNFFDELAYVIKKTKEFGCTLIFPGLELRDEMPIALIRQIFDDDLLQENFRAILREEKELFEKRYQNNHNLHQKKLENYLRAKTIQKTCNARILRGRWLARGNIAQF